MNAQEAADVVREFNALYPHGEYSPAELELVGDECRKYEKHHVIDRVRELKLTSAKLPTLAEIFSPLRARTISRRAGENRTTESQAEIIRRHSPKLASMCDYEVLLRHYRQQWMSCGQRESYRKTLVRKCRTDLITAGMVTDGKAQKFDAWAEHAAEQIFADSETFYSELDVILRDAPRDKK